MKTILKLSILYVVMSGNFSMAQCSNSDLVNQGTIVPTTTPQNTGSANQDRPYWQFAASAGCEYTFTTCGNASWDTYLRIYADGAVGSWTLETSNDDDCGGAYQSTITWTAPASGTYNLLLTRYGSGTCNTLNGNSTYITYSTDCAAAPTCTGSGNANDLCGGATAIAVNASCTTSNWSIDPSYEDCVNPSTNCTLNSQVEDLWYAFTATSTSTTINVANSNRQMLFAVYSGSCGSLTQMACVDAVAGQGTETTSITTSIGVTYYIQIVRTNGDGSSNTMNGTICVYQTPAPTCNDGIQNQGETGIDCGGPCPACPVTCVDLGFENMASGADGVLVTGWQLMIGRNNVAGPYTIEDELSTATYDCSANFTSHNTGALCAGSGGVKVYHSAYQHHDIETSTTAGINDLINVPNLPNLSGSNTRCIRLGGEQQAGWQASGMSTTITVNDPYLVYHYILRFENTGHNINNRGFCTFRIKDAFDNILPCGSFEVYENGPGETWSYDNGWNTWYMPDWESVIMDMTSYIGQSVTIEVWVADCQEGAHAGWGYFDFECLASAIPDCSISPLPIELISFDASCEDNSPMLQWSTASERENDYFTVWHSTNGIDFRKLGFVPGMGNSNTVQKYTWPIDMHTSGVNYYRLSQTDLNGEVEFFDPIAFETCGDQKTYTYQDNSDMLHIVGKQIENVRVVDSQGKMVLSHNQIGDHIILDGSSLVTGVYFVQVMTPNQQVEIHKLHIK